MSIYKVHFTWKEKEYIIKAKSLDLTHPYFVSIKDLMLNKSQHLIIDPSQEEILQKFGDAEHLLIPFQKVSLIEELPDKSEEKKDNVRPFKLLDDEDEGNEEKESLEKKDDLENDNPKDSNTNDITRNQDTSDETKGE